MASYLYACEYLCNLESNWMQIQPLHRAQSNLPLIYVHVTLLATTIKLQGISNQFTERHRAIIVNSSCGCNNSNCKLASEDSVCHQWLERIYSVHSKRAALFLYTRSPEYTNTRIRATTHRHAPLAGTTDTKRQHHYMYLHAHKHIHTHLHSCTCDTHTLASRVRNSSRADSTQIGMVGNWENFRSSNVQFSSTIWSDTKLTSASAASEFHPLHSYLLLLPAAVLSKYIYTEIDI